MTRCWFGWFVCALIAVWFGASVTAGSDTSAQPAPPLEPAGPADDVRSIGPATMVATDVSVVTVDAVGDTGLNPSLVLDAAGNPVIAYRDATNGDLKLVHCDDPLCAGVETPVTVDAAGDTGRDPSLVLDAAGNPVIAYFELTGSEVEDAIGPVRLVHCDDPNCEGVETPVTLDPTGPLGRSASLALDAAGNPIVAWGGLSVRGLLVVQCDDPACVGDETPVNVDPDGRGQPSLMLDAAGDPAIAYREGAAVRPSCG